MAGVPMPVTAPASSATGAVTASAASVRHRTIRSPPCGVPATNSCNGSVRGPYDTAVPSTGSAGATSSSSHGGIAIGLTNSPRVTSPVTATATNHAPRAAGPAATSTLMRRQQVARRTRPAAGA